MANDLLKEAIADAKAVRETALANAKIALEEAFTPRLQSMLSAKLAEEEEGEMDDEIPSEPAPEPAPEMDMEDDPVAAEGRGSMMDADEDPTDVHSEEMAPDEETSEALELEAIIAELEAEISEEDKSSEIGKGNNDLYEEEEADEAPVAKEGRGDKEPQEEDISIDEIINALREEEGDEPEAKNEAEDKDDEKEAKNESDIKEDLEEAYGVIRFLKSKINEVNLLNAKLLFSNKLFKNHSMNESQKMKVIENFDRASSIREVKLVYATLSESLELSGRKTKRSIKESYASTPSRSTRPSKKVISEGTDLAARWKKLANL